jgi:ketosteroid isomerase-like protein
MSSEGVERIRQGLALLNRRDFDAALALADPDFVFENDPGGPLGPTVYRGRAEVKGFWEDFFGTWKDLRAEAKYFRAVGDKNVLVRLHMVAHVEATEAPLEIDTTQLWTLSGGSPRASGPTLTTPKPSKPWGGASRRCRRTTSRLCAGQSKPSTRET